MVLHLLHSLSSRPEALNYRFAFIVYGLGMGCSKPRIALKGILGSVQIVSHYNIA